MDQDSTPGLSVEIVKLEQLPDERVAPGYSCGFAYTIKVENGGKSTVQLQSRKWMIKHSNENIETVEGDGVVGKQPVLKPGQSHTYTSYCLLYTERCSMWGFYFGKDDDENLVIWRIPRFDMTCGKNSSL